MPDLEHVCCADLAEAEIVQRVIHRASGLDGRAVPYITPLRPEDRHGPDDGSTVQVKRLTTPRRLKDGTIAIAYTASVAPLLVGVNAAPGKIAEDLGVTAAQLARLKMLHAARKIVKVEDYSDDQSGIEEIANVYSAKRP